MEVVKKLEKITTLDGLRSTISIPKKQAYGRNGGEYMASSSEAFMALGDSQNVNNLGNITFVSLFSKRGIIIQEKEVGKGACFIVEKFLRSNDRVPPFDSDNSAHSIFIRKNANYGELTQRAIHDRRNGSSINRLDF